jgi:hypothetical protein
MLSHPENRPISATRCQVSLARVTEFIWGTQWSQVDNHMSMVGATYLRLVFLVSLESMMNPSRAQDECQR